MSKPNCCGNQAEYIMISPRVSYFYCRTCKNEVREETAEQVKTRLSNTKLDLVADAGLSPDDWGQIFKDIDDMYGDGADLKVMFEHFCKQREIAKWREADEVV